MTALILVSSFLILTNTLNAVVEIGGTLTGDTTWTNTDTIIVTEAVTVSDLARLTIKAGTIIMFSPGTTINIDGQIIANGLGFSRIVFTSGADTTGGTPVAGDWYGLNFRELGAGTFHNCDLRYGIDNVHIYKSSVEFYDCVIENFSGRGFYIDGYFSIPSITASINNCIIRQDEMSLHGTGTGIYVYRAADVIINGCKISDCTYGMYYLGSGTTVPNFQISNCDIRDHALGGIYTLSGG